MKGIAPGATTSECREAAIVRAGGRTDSERYLGRLGEASFLDLWSYPNVFVDRRSNGGRTDGKELCDLLVVCGDHVLIFSDKSVSWPDVDEETLAWSRWFRRAVKKSADQVRGAERWIRQHPGRLFLDPACTKPFPIELPPPERRRVHGIVVALGAAEAAGGTIVSGPEWANEAEDGKHEMGVRFMALENRVQRRTYGGGIINALERIGTSPRFARGFIPTPNQKNAETGYVFMLLQREVGLPRGYQHYREVRSSMLYGYAINTLRRHQHLKRVIGIATEPPAKYTGEAGSSEDLVYVEIPVWTEAEYAEAERFREHYKIFKDDTLNEYNVHADEYPSIPAGVELSYTNPIDYDFLHPEPSGEELLAQQRRRRGRAVFKAWLLSGVS